jgi:hypothetical protein
MVDVEHSVEINTDPETVFSLVTDIPRKARLDPNATVLGVVQETEGPVAIGTTFHYRLVIEGKIADYRSRCTAFEPGRMIETLSDSDPPFTVRVTVAPSSNGARLTQRESFTVPRIHIPLPTADGWHGRLLRLLFGNRDAIQQDPSASRDEEARMVAKLKQRLEKWLEAIKQELESQQSRLKA